MNDSRLEGPIEPDEARLLLGRGEAVAIDLRDPDEVAESRVPAAVMVRGDDLTAAAERARAGKDVPILVVCEDGERSQKAAAKLEEAGIEATPIAGGWKNWVESGQPTQPKSTQEFEGPDLSAGPGS